MLEPEPPGQQPITMTAIACSGITPKARDRIKPVKGMMPNWQRKPMKMPQGRLRWLNSFLESTVQPMENMTIASITVSPMLNTTFSISFRLLGGTRQLAPEQTVALESQTRGPTVVGSDADMADVVMGEGVKNQWLPLWEKKRRFPLRFHKTSPAYPPPRRYPRMRATSVQLTLCLSQTTMGGQ